MAGKKKTTKGKAGGGGAQKSKANKLKITPHPSVASDMATPDDEDNFYFIEPDQPVEVTEDEGYNETKLQVLAAIDKKFPGRYFEPGIDFNQVDLADIHDYSKTKKCVFEVMTIGHRSMKKLDGGSIRFFDTNTEQVAATLNFFVFSAEHEVYLGDIMNVLLDKNEDGGLEVIEVDFLVEARFFQPG